MRAAFFHAGLITILIPSIGGCIDLSTDTPPPGSGGGGAGATGGGGSGGAGGSGGGSPCADCTWSRRYGDDMDQRVSNVAMDDEGSVFVTGSYDGSMFLGPNVGLTDVNGSTTTQAYLAKFDLKGNPQWIKNPEGYESMGGTGTEVAAASGLVVWAGGVGDDPILHDIFVEIHHPDGSRVKTILGSQWHDVSTGIALSADGKSLFLSGIVHGSASTFTGCPAVAPFDAGSDPDLLVVSLDTATGACKWGKVFGGGNHVGGTMSIAVGTDGNPVVSGLYVGGTINGTGLPVGTAGFVMKLGAADGAILGSKSVQGLQPLAMDIDRTTGRIIVAGGQTTDILFGNPQVNHPGPTTSGDEGAIAIVAFETNLAESWSRFLDGPAAQFVQYVTVNEAGRIYATGVTAGTFVIAPNMNADCPASDVCAFLLELEGPEGALLASKARIFGQGQPKMAGLVLPMAARKGALAVAGAWGSDITLLDGIPLAASGSVTGDFDVVVGRFFQDP